MEYKRGNQPAGQPLVSWIRAVEGWGYTTYFDYHQQRIQLAEDTEESVDEAKAEYKMSYDDWGPVKFVYVPCKVTNVRPFNAPPDWEQSEDRRPLYWLVVLNHTTEDQFVQDFRDHITSGFSPTKVDPGRLIRALGMAEARYGKILRQPLAEIRSRIRSGCIGPDLGRPERRTPDPVGLAMAAILLFTRMNDDVWELLRDLHRKSPEERSQVLDMIEVHNRHVLHGDQKSPGGFEYMFKNLEMRT